MFGFAELREDSNLKLSVGAFLVGMDMYAEPARLPHWVGDSLLADSATDLLYHAVDNLKKLPSRMACKREDDTT